jgi:hypothetical protein
MLISLFFMLISKVSGSTRSEGGQHCQQIAWATYVLARFLPLQDGGNPNSHCHQPNDRGRGPNLRLTYKLKGKSVIETLPDPAALRKAGREICEFRKLQSCIRNSWWSMRRSCQLPLVGPVGPFTAGAGIEILGDRRPADARATSVATG